MIIYDISSLSCTHWKQVDGLSTGSLYIELRLWGHVTSLIIHSWCNLSEQRIRNVHIVVQICNGEQMVTMKTPGLAWCCAGWKMKCFLIVEGIINELS